MSLLTSMFVLGGNEHEARVNMFPSHGRADDSWRSPLIVISMVSSCVQALIVKSVSFALSVRPPNDGVSFLLSRLLVFGLPSLPSRPPTKRCRTPTCHRRLPLGIR